MRILENVFFALFVLLHGSTVFASLVKDVVLSTTDRSCHVHYLTHGNTTGWFLTEVDGSCSKGKLSGVGSVVIRDAFGNEEEKLTGYFNQGYWLGSDFLNVPLKTLLLNHDSEEQFLTYELGKEERLDIQYLGKMTSTRRSDKTYGPFLACDPVRVLAITSDMDLFADENVQHNLISSVVQKARAICPETLQIQFYAADRDDPQNEDIFFFADIDLETQHIKVRRVPTSSRDRKAIKIETTEPILEDNVMPVENKDSEEKEILYPTPLPPVDPMLKQSEVATFPVLDANTEMRLDKIPHLLTASRLLKQPVEGKVLVHVERFDETGRAVVDKPVVLTAKGSGLSLGWGVLSGRFEYLSPNGKLEGTRGRVEVDSFIPYDVRE
jgi:hypothetical protein